MKHWPEDLLQDFSTVADNGSVAGWQRERLWVKVLSDTLKLKLSLAGAPRLSYASIEVAN